MNDSTNHDPATAMSDGCNDPEQTEEERIFFSEASDERLETAASGLIITFTLSIDLFACRFCHQAMTSPREICCDAQSGLLPG